MQHHRLAGMLGFGAALALVANLVLARQALRTSDAHRRTALASLDEMAAVALDRYASSAEGLTREAGSPLLFPVDRPQEQPDRLRQLRDIIRINRIRQEDPCRCLPMLLGEVYFATSGVDDPAAVAVDSSGKLISPPAWVRAAASVLDTISDRGARLYVIPLETLPARPFLLATAGTGRDNTIYGTLIPAKLLVSDVLERAWQMTRLVPRLLPREVTNVVYLTVSVESASGQPLFRSPVTFSSPHQSRLRLEPRRGAMVYSATLNPVFEATLVAGGIPRPPVRRIMLSLAVTLAALVAVGGTAWRSLELARLRTDFTSSVSHELRTPLTQIRLAAETILLARLRTDTERRTALQGIVTETNRMQQLVDNVLHFSRAERSLLRAEQNPLAIAPVLEETHRDFQPLAALREIRILLTVPPNLEAVGDPQAIRQVVLNLLDNAVRYSPTGSEITVEAAHDNGGIRITVSDNGPGIPPKYRERVWLPFERLTWAGDGHATGGGLGLAVVRELVTAMGGVCQIVDAPVGCRIDVVLRAVG